MGGVTVIEWLAILTGAFLSYIVLSFRAAREWKRRIRYIEKRLFDDATIHRHPGMLGPYKGEDEA